MSKRETLAAIVLAGLIAAAIVVPRQSVKAHAAPHVDPPSVQFCGFGITPCRRNISL